MFQEKYYQLKDKKSDNEIAVSEGDLVIINVGQWYKITSTVLTGDIVKTENNNPNKRRPIVIYKVEKNIASYFATSTYDKAFRPLSIKFDYSRCKTSNCKMKLNKDGYIFFLTKYIKRDGKKNELKATFNFNITKLSSYIKNSKDMELKDIFYICGKCSKTYIEEIIRRIDNPWIQKK